MWFDPNSGISVANEIYSNSKQAYVVDFVSWDSESKVEKHLNMLQPETDG